VNERFPNFLYIGTSKAGSTWIYDVLNRHPDIFMAPGKGLYFFSRHYERGLGWYASHFSGAADERIIGEVSHAYLYDEEACERIAETSPDMRLMVCLRDPVDRAFSEYLDAHKNGKLEVCFEEALLSEPDLLERGRYATYISRYLERFPRDQLHVAVFDDLAADPDRFAGDLFRFLKVEQRPLSNAQRRRMLPAGVPRSTGLARAAKRGAHFLQRIGLRGLRGRLKTSRSVRNALYRPLGEDERPTMNPETRMRLRAQFAAEVAELDALLGTSLSTRWGYES
jgi:hypothetical protein